MADVDMGADALTLPVFDRGFMMKKFLRFAVAIALVLVGLFAASVAHGATGYVGVAAFSGPGSGPGQLAGPQRAAVRTATGQLFVADRDNDRVQIFDTATNSVAGQFGDSSSMDDPFGIAVDQASGAVYVSSAVSGSITKWGDAGLGYVRDVLFLSPALGSDPGQVGSFASPLAVDPTTGDLLVGDTANQRIARFDASGVHSDPDFMGDSSPGAQVFGQVKDIATDAGGDLYVVDGGRVVRFNQDDSYDATLDTVGGPALVTVDPSSGDAVVVTSSDDGCAADRVWVYAGAQLQSSSAIGPVGGDCSFPGGLAATAAGVLYAPTFDVCGGGCGSSVLGVQVLDRSVVLADVSIDPASDVAETTATLNGAVNPQGGPATYRFEYSSDDGASWTQMPESGALGGTNSVPVQASVTGLTDASHYTVRLVATRQGVRSYSTQRTFDSVDGDPPTVALTPASDLTSSSATVNGTVDPNGLASTYRLEYSTDEGASFTALAGLDGDPGVDDPVGDGTTNVGVSGAIADLEPGREYPYRLIATNAIGASQVDGTLTTLSVAADVETTAATGVTFGKAVLHGSVNAHNDPATYHFEYGTDTTYGTTTPTAEAAADNTANPVAATLTGLDPSRTYHYKLVADNATGGPISGPDQTFTTLDQPATPITGQATDVTTNSATLHGTVDTHGHPGSFRFMVTQTDGSHLTTTTDTPVPAGPGAVAVSAPVTGLPAAGHYTVQLSVTTSGGDHAGQTTTFATTPLPPFVPPAPETGQTGSGYGCENPHLDPYTAKAKPGQTITLKGSDLGLTGNVGYGSGSVEASAYGPTAVTFTIPSAATGSQSVRVNCGKSSNAIALSIAARPSNTFSLTSKVDGARLTLQIKAPGAGKLTIDGRNLAGTRKTLSKQGTVNVTVKLTKAGRRALARARSHRLTVRLRVRFTPTGGTTKTTIRAVTFKRKGGR